MERPKLEEDADADCWKRGAADYNHKEWDDEDKKDEYVSFQTLGLVVTG